MDVPLQGTSVTTEQFRALALAELPAVRRFAWHLTHDGAEADDLVQEAYVRALASADRFELPATGIRPWLFRILHNALRNRRRDAPLRLTVELDADDAPSTAPPVAGRLDTLDWEQVDERIVHAVNDLPEEYRVVFLLFAAEDLKYRQIAAVLEIPIGTVMSRLARARRLLTERLRAVTPDPGDDLARMIAKD